MTNEIKKRISWLASLIVVSTLLMTASAFIASAPVDAQVNACSALPSTRGLATHTESGVAAGNYTVFARVKVASGAATFDLSIDGQGGSLCNHQVSQSGSNGNWVWYSSGGTTLNWTSSGDMRFQMSGDKDGVGLDCIVLFDLSTGSFNPSTKEDCNPPAGTTDGGSTTGTTTSGNTTGSSGGGTCLAEDVNENGEVDFPDFTLVVINYGSTPSNPRVDIDGSGTVDFPDFTRVVINYGNQQACN